ncbi:MAG: mismatch repair protein MutT [Candidatus Doudnabacteria bacterium]|nr:mismatch repair protein MutT [Candidatus Doudnabacteria bacterium]
MKNSDTVPQQKNNMVLQVGVKALLRNQEGKFLIVHRSKEKYPEVKNLWDIVGGRIEPGTNVVDNLKREIFEETKLELKHHPMLLAAQDIIKPDKHVVRLTYMAPIEGEPVLDAEHDDFMWASVEDIIALPGLDDYLSQLLLTAKEQDQKGK